MRPRFYLDAIERGCRPRRSPPGRFLARAASAAGAFVERVCRWRPLPSFFPGGMRSSTFFVVVKRLSSQHFLLRRTVARCCARVPHWWPRSRKTGISCRSGYTGKPATAPSLRQPLCVCSGRHPWLEHVGVYWRGSRPRLRNPRVVLAGVRAHAEVTVGCSGSLGSAFFSRHFSRSERHFGVPAVDPFLRRPSETGGNRCGPSDAHAALGITSPSPNTLFEHVLLLSRNSGSRFAERDRLCRNHVHQLPAWMPGKTRR